MTEAELVAMLRAVAQGITDGHTSGSSAICDAVDVKLFTRAAGAIERLTAQLSATETDHNSERVISNALRNRVKRYKAERDRLQHVADMLERMPSREAIDWSVAELQTQARERRQLAQEYSEGPRRDVREREADWMANVAAWLGEITNG